MFKAFEAIKITEDNLSFLDMFQYQVDDTGQLRLSMVSQDLHSTPVVERVADEWPSDCVPTEK